eukprot:g20960.t1
MHFSRIFALVAAGLSVINLHVAVADNGGGGRGGRRGGGGGGGGGGKGNHIGCFQDNKNDRVLDYMMSSRDMTSEKCATHCAKSSDNKYYATQYGEECWCAAQVDTRLRKGKCDYACSGDARTTCGGYNAFDLFEMKRTPSPPTDSPSAPTGSNYRGCFRDNKKDRVLDYMMTSRDMTSEKCATHCAKSSDNKYYATQYGEECWCAAQVDTRLRTGTCDFACSGDARTTCGGYNAFDLFEMKRAPSPATDSPSAPTEDYYVGCFRDNKDDRVLEHKKLSRDMTLEVCKGHCASRNKPFAALQYGKECWCGGCELVEDRRSKYDRHGTASCEKPCSGDSTRQCGGYDAFSLYQVGTCGQPDDGSCASLSAPACDASANQVCEDGTDGTGVCVCDTGYTNTDTTGGLTCTLDDGSCASLSAPACDASANQVCEDGTDGTGVCVCDTGYTNTDTTGGLTCTLDDGSCASPSAPACDASANQVCEDGTDGTGVCVCDTGYTNTDTTGGLTCTLDDGSCASLSAPACDASANQVCEDGTDGIGACVCDTGFSDPDLADSELTCNADGSCAGVSAPTCDTSANQVCQDGADGTGACVCDTGYTNTDTTGSLTCTLDGSCAGVSAPTCDTSDNQVCQDGADGTGACVCDTGYTNTDTTGGLTCREVCTQDFCYGNKPDLVKDGVACTDPNGCTRDYCCDKLSCSIIKPCDQNEVCNGPLFFRKCECESGSTIDLNANGLTCIPEYGRRHLRSSFSRLLV